MHTRSKQIIVNHILRNNLIPGMDSAGLEQSCIIHLSSQPGSKFARITEELNGIAPICDNCREPNNAIALVRSPNDLDKQQDFGGDFILYECRWCEFKTLLQITYRMMEPHPGYDGEAGVERGGWRPGRGFPLSRE